MVNVVKEPHADVVRGASLLGIRVLCTRKIGCTIPGAATLIQVEDFFERAHEVVGVGFDAGEEGLHVLLPAGIDGQSLHGGACAVEVVGEEIAHEEAVGTEKEGVVVPAGVRESCAHFGPDFAVALAVFLEVVRVDVEGEADSLHVGSMAAIGS